MSTIYTIEGNTSSGNTLVANGGQVAKKSYLSTYSRIAVIWRPRYKNGEAEKVVAKAVHYNGYLEKKSRLNLTSFKKNAGYNNYNMFADHARKETKNGVYVNGYAWCDMFVDDMFIRALGTERAKVLLGGWSAYTPTSSAYLKNAGAKKLAHFENAKFGDIIFFKNTSGEICHVGIVITGYKGNNKDHKPAKVIYNQKDFIEDVMKITKTKSAKAALNKTKTLSVNKNNQDPLVLPVQKYLNYLGYYEGTCDKIYGSKMSMAAHRYQREVLKYTNCDYEITKKSGMWKHMLGL